MRPANRRPSSPPVTQTAVSNMVEATSGAPLVVRMVAAMNCKPLALILGSAALAALAVAAPVRSATADDELTGVSPLYTEYNTFINAANFLELVSVGADPVSAKVSFFRIDGSLQKAIRVEIPAFSQVDLDVNTLVGTRDTYGVIKVEYNRANPDARLQGRMSIYRLEEGGSTITGSRSRNGNRRTTDTNSTTGIDSSANANTGMQNTNNGFSNTSMTNNSGFAVSALNASTINTNSFGASTDGVTSTGGVSTGAAGFGDNSNSSGSFSNTNTGSGGGFGAATTNAETGGIIGTTGGATAIPGNNSGEDFGDSGGVLDPNQPNDGVNENMDDFSFAYSLPLRAPLTENSYVTSNTYDPQGRGFLVPNWLSITNVSETTERFTHYLYDQGGALRATEMVTLAPNERRDLDGSDATAEAVFLNEIVPERLGAQYLASVIRYASNAAPSQRMSSYLYAMPIFARPGAGETQFLPISNREESCWSQTNWVEVANVSNEESEVELNFRDAAGRRSGSTRHRLAPRSQFHFNASSVLEMRGADSGTVSVAMNRPNSMLVQSVVYFHDCDSNNLQTAYNIPGSQPASPPFNGSFNRFLGMQNELVTFGTAGLSQQIDLGLRESGNSIFDSQFDLPALGSERRDLNTRDFNTSPDTYGLIQLDSQSPYPFSAYNLRNRRRGDVMDFVMPIPIR